MKFHPTRTTSLLQDRLFHGRSFQRVLPTIRCISRPFSWITRGQSAGSIIVRSLNLSVVLVCQDGSPAAYYLRKPLAPAAAGTVGWVIFMEGGGWCGSDGNCYQRSLTDLGSSTKYPAVMGGAEGEGLYAQFATFNIVYMKYCGER